MVRCRPEARTTMRTVNVFMRDLYEQGLFLNYVTSAVFPGVPSATVTVVAVF